MYSSSNYFQSDVFKTAAAILAVVVFLVVFVFVVLPNMATNSAISQEESITAERKNITVLVNRKITVLTNLVESVEQATLREEEILSAVIGLRNAAQSPDGAFQDTAKAIDVLVEAYPDLKSIEGYNTLMKEISITENGLAQSRIAYNGLVKSYQVFVRTWPNRSFLAMNGYQVQSYEQIEYDESVEQGFDLFKD